MWRCPRFLCPPPLVQIFWIRLCQFLWTFASIKVRVDHLGPKLIFVPVLHKFCATEGRSFAFSGWAPPSPDPGNNYDLDPVTLAHNLWPWSLRPVTFVPNLRSEDQRPCFRLIIMIIHSINSSVCTMQTDRQTDRRDREHYLFAGGILKSGIFSGTSSTLSKG